MKNGGKKKVMTHNRLNFLLFEYITPETIIDWFGHLLIVTRKKPLEHWRMDQYYHDNQLANMIKTYDYELYKEMINERRKSKKKKK